MTYQRNPDLENLTLQLCFNVLDILYRIDILTKCNDNFWINDN